MALNTTGAGNKSVPTKLTEDDRAFWEDVLAKAVPYDDDAPELYTFDGDDHDHGRMMATIAKRILEGRL